MTEDEKRSLATMSDTERNEWLASRYQKTYDWVKEQPCSSYDFVSVPIESLAEFFNE